ncbi:LAFA_0E03818g1_1 [Lachancea sp. 'fantastica']|nr:LAFA_0E03818g1_1 [Lachancea sp. 'fantastica']
MVKRVAIIGAGPGGLVTGKVLLANTHFEIVLYDCNTQVGGVWCYPDDEQGRKNRAMYNSLEANLSKQIMTFNGFPFPDDVPTFPNRQQVWEYLVCFYETFIEGQERIVTQFNCRVDRLQKTGDVWHVSHSNEKVVEVFDFVVVANGHFEAIHIPSDIPGANEWRQERPDSLVHSKEFQSSDRFRGQRVVVVGNGSSGSDIANQISSVAQCVYHSVKEISKTDWDDNPVVTAVPVISKLNVRKNRTVTLENGEQLENIDCIVWATGYMYYLPFLGSYQEQILGTGKTGRDPVSRLHGLWRQMVFAQDPTLAFVLLCKNVVPFPLAESQACVIAKVFCGSIEVPSIDASEWASRDVKDYHSLLTPRDIEYCRELQAILDSCGGKDEAARPKVWDNQLAALRYQTGSAKKERTRLLVRRALELRDKGQAYYLE